METSTEGISKSALTQKRKQERHFPHLGMPKVVQSEPPVSNWPLQEMESV
jgi:hypothetical protein